MKTELNVLSANDERLNDDAWEALREFAYGLDYAKPEVGYSWIVATDALASFVKDVEANPAGYSKASNAIATTFKAILPELTRPLTLIVSEGDMAKFLP